MRLIHYFTDLGFYADEALLGAKDALAVAGVYAAIALGIFLRQISGFPAIDFRPDNLRLGIAVGSVILALVIAPPLMRWIAKRHKGRPTWEQIAWSLTYGFFSQLIMAKLLAEIAKSGT